MTRTQVEVEPAKGKENVALNSADDLLAQLAGDEVDRMLSEADAAAPEPLNVDRAIPESSIRQNVAASMPPADGHEVVDATEAALDGIFDELNSSATEPAPIANKSTEPVPPVDKQSIEEVLTQRAHDLIAQARIEEDTDTQAAAIDSAGASSEALSAADALAAEMEADEAAHMEALARMKGAPAEPKEAAPAATQAAPTQAAPTVIDEDKVDFSKPDKADRIPLLVRILEWINAPLDGLSDKVREALGKIALITTLNAVAVLLYVVIFRRH